MRRLSWMLWLLIALLPVRGIAQSLMVGGAFGHDTSAATASAENPCPMHTGNEAAASDTTAPAHDAGSSTHVCSLCNVCHSAVLPLALPPTPSAAVHDAAPLPALGIGAGRAAPSELFRPPR